MYMAAEVAAADMAEELSNYFAAEDFIVYYNPQTEAEVAADVTKLCKSMWHQKNFLLYFNPQTVA